MGTKKGNVFDIYQYLANICTTANFLGLIKFHLEQQNSLKFVCN